MCFSSLGAQKSYCVDLENRYTPPDLGPSDEATRYSYNLDQQLTILSVSVSVSPGKANKMSYRALGVPCTTLSSR
ncbi:MAG: hypothetical protein HY028_08590 [Gammaproteobacteria bacterium]|nr:hypothetical protein [Gammaproteobacteria bacterium]